MSDRGFDSRDSSPFHQKHLRVKGALEYANLVAAHAHQATSDSLYPGQNYENLSQYLLQPYQPKSYIAPFAELSSNKNVDSAFAILYNLGSNEPAKEFYSHKDFDGIEHLGATETGHLLFLRGNPTADWLNTIGYKCNVDPEFFLRHLDFRSTAGKPDYFQLPSLPSANNNYIRLHWTTIGSRATFEGSRHDQEEIEFLRQDSAKRMAQYLDHIRFGRKMNMCDSFVRQFSIHDETHFSFEQDASICINPIGESWIAIVWQDVGSDLTSGPNGPWLASPNQKSYSWTTRALPTLQFQPKMALKARMAPTRTESNGRRSRDFVQSASLLHRDYGQQLDTDMMSNNAFYALSELFKFTAACEIQFLNMMETKLLKETDFSVINSRHSPTLSNLLYNKRILDQHVHNTVETISSIKTWGKSDLDEVPDGGHELRTEASISANQLLGDFEYLLDRAKALSAHCDRGMHIVMNNNMLVESQRAIEQAAGVAKLTRLAFFYIPLSFTTSFFGMNFVQFGTGELSIWLWFAVSIPIFFVSVLFLAVDLPAWTKATWVRVSERFMCKST